MRLKIIYKRGTRDLSHDGSELATMTTRITKVSTLNTMDERERERREGGTWEPRVENYYLFYIR